MVPFYTASRDYIRKEREKSNADELWKDLEKSIPELLRRDRASELPTLDEVCGFLDDERDSYDDQALAADTDESGH
jgi:hypothetical protein